MSEQQNEQSKRNTGCFLNGVIIILLIVIAFGVFGGALAGEGMQRTVTIYPDLPVDASTLGVQSSVVVLPAATPTLMVYEPVVVYQAPMPTPVVVPFVVQQSRVPSGCDAQVTQLVPGGWAVGVSRLPACWDSWTAEQKDLFMRTQRGPEGTLP